MGETTEAMAYMSVAERCERWGNSAGSGGGVVLREDKAPWALWTPSDGSLLGFRNLGGEPRAFLASNDEKGKTEIPI